MNRRPASLRIGLDFDNTIICYDGVFRAAAIARGLLPGDFVGGKQQVRDAVRLLAGGELNWQRLQGHVYGKGLEQAEPFVGLHAFLGEAKQRGDEVFIVSHKTEHGHFDPDKVNLRDAARSWMAAQGFFTPEGAAIKPANVFFALTRAEKLARIAAIGCDVFIDDLEEVLDDPDFPAATRRVLFAQAADAGVRPYQICDDWRGVAEAVFHAG